MSIRLTNMEITPGVVLSWTSGLMWMYPWVMRVSLLLHRLVQ
jgi:hypothetical protein